MKAGMGADCKKKRAENRTPGHAGEQDGIVTDELRSPRKRPDRPRPRRGGLPHFWFAKRRNLWHPPFPCRTPRPNRPPPPPGSPPPVPRHVAIIMDGKRKAFLHRLFNERRHPCKAKELCRIADEIRLRAAHLTAQDAGERTAEFLRANIVNRALFSTVPECLIGCRILVRLPQEHLSPGFRLLQIRFLQRRIKDLLDA